MRNILEFPGRFAPPAAVITLDRNYRSTQPILDAANAVIAEAPSSSRKIWWPTAGRAKAAARHRGRRSSAGAICRDQVLRHRENGIDLRGQAVLFRTASHSAQLELELARGIFRS